MFNTFLKSLQIDDVSPFLSAPPQIDFPRQASPRSVLPRRHCSCTRTCCAWRWRNGMWACPPSSHQNIALVSTTERSVLNSGTAVFQSTNFLWNFKDNCIVVCYCVSSDHAFNMEFRTSDAVIAVRDKVFVRGGRDKFRSRGEGGGGGVAEVSCLNIFSIACSKIKWFARILTLIRPPPPPAFLGLITFCPKMAIWKNLGDGTSAPPPPPPRLVRLGLLRNACLLGEGSYKGRLIITPSTSPWNVLLQMASRHQWN